MIGGGSYETVLVILQDLAATELEEVIYRYLCIFYEIVVNWSTFR